MTHFACCWRSGEIDILSSKLAIPEGVIPFARGPRDILEQIVSVRARHSYHSDNYLVPGLPEEDDGESAVAALEAWVGWAFAIYPDIEGVRVVS